MALENQLKVALCQQLIALMTSSQVVICHIAGRLITVQHILHSSCISIYWVRAGLLLHEHYSHHPSRQWHDGWAGTA